LFQAGCALSAASDLPDGGCMMLSTLLAPSYRRVSASLDQLNG
jgi:hypothetical protein